VAAATAAMVVLFATQGLGLRAATPAAAAPGHTVLAALGPPAGIQTLLGEQRWYTMLTYKLSDQLSLEVNVANGNLVVREQALQVKGTGLDLKISQFANSLASGKGSVGAHWRLNLSRDVGLQFPGNGSAVFTAPTGYSVTFANVNGAFEDPPGLDASLVKNSDGTYTLTFHQSGEKYQFNSTGVFTSDVDRDGNAITFAYGTGGAPTSITDTQGRVVKITNGSNGLISQIADSTGRTAAYAYDASGNLTAFTNLAGGATAFAYNAASDPTKVTDPAGHVYTLAYDSTHRVTSIASSTGPTTTFAYSGSTTAVTDPNGSRTTYTADTSGRVTQVVDSQGHTSKTTYTADDSPAQLTDALNDVTTVSYDSQQNATSGKAATGAQMSAAYGDTAHPFAPTQATDPEANVTKYTYGTRGNLTQVTDAVGDLTKYAYNGNGTISSLTDPDGNVTTYQYDSAGNLTGVLPHGSDFTYDASSRIVTSTDGNSQKTTFTYDALDRTTKVTYADGTSASQTFDADGNRTKLVDGTGTTTFAYDKLGRLVSKTLPSGEVISLGYDAAGNLTSEQDSSGTTTYSYNSLGLVDSVVDPSGNLTTFQYDAADRLVTTAYPNGVLVKETYDGANDVTSLTASNSTTTLLQRTYTYQTSPSGTPTFLVSSVVDELGLITSYGYDALNRLTSQVVFQQPGGAGPTGSRAVGGNIDSRSYSWDPLGFRTSQTINKLVTDYSFNTSNGSITATSHMVGGPTLGTLTYNFDADGNLTSRSDGLTIGYDAANFTTSESTGTPVAMTYTGLDQTQRVKEGSTSFVYEPTGLSRIVTGSGTTFVTRGPKGGLVSQRTSSGTDYFITDPMGSTIGLTGSTGSLVSQWTYDPFGEVRISTVNVSTPLLFQGGYSDLQGFSYMGDRFYDPATGRYLQPSGRGVSATDPRTANPQTPDPRVLNPWIYRLDNPVSPSPVEPQQQGAS
jgi:RHS repeat-associated protein